MKGGKERVRWLKLTRFGYGLIGVWGLLGAIATGSSLPAILALEDQTQVLFFRLRGTAKPPSEIVILSMDQESLARGEDYLKDPTRYPELEPIQSWPWQRTAYATVIEKLMVAGARSVSVDVILADPSSYGERDDQQLQKVIQKYAGRVVLANSYEAFGTPETGEQGQITQPNPIFDINLKRVGLINFVPNADGRIHQLGNTFIDQVLKPQEMQSGFSTFAEVTLAAAQIPTAEPKGRYIFFYGPPTTFQRVPFWQVIDPTNWQVHLRDGTFKDKIVLIGPTATSLQDFVRAPFSDTMPGVELHANAIATLMENRAIAVAIPNPIYQGLLILFSVASVGLLLVRLKKPVVQSSSALAIAALWGVGSYVAFTYGGWILPTAVPVLIIALSGLSCLATGAISNRLEQLRLRRTLERYVAAPIVQEILTQRSDDYQELLKGRKVKAAVLFSDIRGFTHHSLQLAPEQLVEQLNDYLNAMVEPILEAGGTVDKFIGDAVMAEFGSPISQGEKVDAMNAIRAALGMRRALVTLHQQWQLEGKALFFNGIGINFGEAIAGDIGSIRRREYALIGDAVNIASRVEGLTRQFWTDILITDSLYQLVQDEVDVVCIGEHTLKGRGENLIKLYSLLGLKGEDHKLYHHLHEIFRKMSHS